MKILAKPLLSRRREPASLPSVLMDEDDELLPLGPPAISLTGKPELVLELLTALPDGLPLEQQRNVIHRALEQRAPVDPDTLLGEVTWKKREALQVLKRLEEEQEAEQAAITAEIEVLWNRREAVGEAFAHQGAALRRQVEQMDRLLVFLGAEDPTEPPKSEPPLFLSLV